MIAAAFLVLVFALPTIDSRLLADRILLSPELESVHRRLAMEGIILNFTAAAGWIIFLIFAGTQGVRHVRERTELELAEKVPQTLVPPLELRTPGYEIHGRSIPSSQMGGDLLDAVGDGGCVRAGPGRREGGIRAGR
jgi:hypothetical protein